MYVFTMAETVSNTNSICILTASSISKHEKANDKLMRHNVGLTSERPTQKSRPFRFFTRVIPWKERFFFP